VSSTPLSDSNCERASYSPFHNPGTGNHSKPEFQSASKSRYAASAAKRALCFSERDSGQTFELGGGLNISRDIHEFFVGTMDDHDVATQLQKPPISGFSCQGNPTTTRVESGHLVAAVTTATPSQEITVHPSPIIAVIGVSGITKNYDRPPVSSISVAAPNFMMATPPASLARRSWSFSRSQSESVSSKRRSGVAGSEGFEVDGGPPGHRASLISRFWWRPCRRPPSSSRQRDVDSTSSIVHASTRTPPVPNALPRECFIYGNDGVYAEV
jgi:hypothetical protein